MERVVAKRQCPKILLTGTHSTGKTALVSSLAGELGLASLRTVGELARECPFSLNFAQNQLSTMWLIAAQIKAEIEAHTTPSTALVVCDRGIPDILGYHELIVDDGAEPWRTIAAEWMGSYDHIFLAQPDPALPMAPDDLRVTSHEVRHGIQRIIERHVVGSGVRYQVLPHDFSGRLACVAGRLRMMGVLS